MLRKLWSLRWIINMVTRYGVEWLVGQHWPAITRVLDEEGFLDDEGVYNSGDIMVASRIACRRMVEHIL